MRTRAQTTKRQVDRHHSITLSFLPPPPPKPSLINPLHPLPPRTLPPFQPTTPCQRRKSAHRPKTDVRAHTTEARKREMWDRSDGIGFQERGGGVIEFLMKDEWWWIDVMARNPTARHRKGASAVESQRSYSYSIRVASSSSIHTAHTVPLNTALLIPLPPHRHHKVPPSKMENVQLPALWKLVRREPDGCAWAERIRWNGERGEGWWWVVGAGVWMEMGVVRNVVGRRKGEN